jgi:hypothetical protein
MEKLADKIFGMIDKNNDILHIAKFFGGINELLNITKKYPYLNAIIQTKLGGYLYCSAADEVENMVPFELPFIMTELEDADIDDVEHYNANVNLIIPELDKVKDMQVLYSWLEDYLMDMGAEVGSFNDGNLNKKMIWIYVTEINGVKLDSIAQMSVSDQEVLSIIPDNYIKD